MNTRNKLIEIFSELVKLLETRLFDQINVLSSINSLLSSKDDFKTRHTERKQEIKELSLKESHLNLLIGAIESVLEKAQKDLEYEIQLEQVGRSNETIRKKKIDKLKNQFEEEIEEEINERRENLAEQRGKLKIIKTQIDIAKKEKNKIVSKLNAIRHWLRCLGELEVYFEELFLQEENVSIIHVLARDFSQVFKIVMQAYLGKTESVEKKTPLMMAIQSQQSPLYIKALLMINDVDPNKGNINGDLPIHLAAELGDNVSLELLMAKDIRFELCNSKGKLPSQLYPNKSSSMYDELLKRESRAQQEVEERNNKDSSFNIKLSIKKMVDSFLNKDQLDDIANQHRQIQLLAVSSAQNEEKKAEMLEDENLRYRFVEDPKSGDNYLGELKDRCVRRAKSYLKAFKLIIEKKEDSALGDAIKIDLRNIKEKTVNAVDKIIDSFRNKKNYSECVTALENMFHVLLSSISAIPIEDAGNVLRNAENRMNWLRKRPLIITHLRSETMDLIQIDQSVSSITDRQKEEWQSIRNNNPAWFLKLPSWEQDHWREVFIDSESTEDGKVEKLLPWFGTPPSTIRAYPGIANCAIHTFSCCDKDFDPKEAFQLSRLRSAVIVPREICDKKDKDEGIQLKKERIRLTVQNIQQLIQLHLEHISGPFIKRYGLINRAPGKLLTIPVLMQTLLTNMKKSWLPGYEGDLVMDKAESIQVIENAVRDFQYKGIRFEFISTNYTVNMKAKRPLVNKTHIAAFSKIIKATHDFLCLFIKDIDRKNIRKFRNIIANLKSILEKIEENRLDEIYFESIEIECENPTLETRFQLIQFLLQEYWNLQQHSTNLRTYSFLSHVNVPLFIAAIEELLVCSINGIVHSSCKSGKDRRAMALMYEDAILACFYHAKSHGLVRNIIRDQSENNVRQVLFRSIVAELFQSEHHNDIAECNAEGCFALKSVADVLPKSILAQIKASRGDTMKRGLWKWVVKKNHDSSHLSVLEYHSVCSELNHLEENFRDKIKASLERMRDYLSRSLSPSVSMENGEAIFASEISSTDISEITSVTDESEEKRQRNRIGGN